MKSTSLISFAQVLAFGYLLTDSSHAQPFSLMIRPAGARVELSWPTTLTNSQQSVISPEYEVEKSSDLVTWQPIGGKVRGGAAASTVS